MINPNHPPIPPQAPEVHVDHVVTQTLPERNLPPVPEQTWHAQVLELDSVLDGYRQAHNDYQIKVDGIIRQLMQQGYSPDQAQQFVAGNHFNKRGLDAEYQKMAAIKANALNYVSDMMTRNNPETVFDLLVSRGRTFLATEKKAAAKPHGTAAAVNQATHNIAAANFHVRAAEDAHAGKDLKDPKNKGAARDLERAHADNSTIMSRSRRERKAHMQALRNRAATEGQADLVFEIVDKLDEDRNRAIEEATTDLQLINTDLEQFPLNGPIDPTELGNMQAVLEDVATSMNKLSRHDPERANLLTAYISMSYRLKQREIATNVAEGKNINAEFTPDGGIIINPNTPEEAVIYDNGDQARVARDASGNVFITPRTRADGTPSEITPDTRIPQIHSEYERRYDFPAEELAAWDEARSPERTARAHAELKCYNKTIEGMEAAAESAHRNAWDQKPRIEHFIDATRHNIARATHDIRTNQILINQIDAHLRSLDPNDPQFGQKRDRAIFDHQQATLKLQQAHQALPQLRAQEAKAHADWRTNEQTLHNSGLALKEARHKLGSGRYWQGMLETRMSPEAPLHIKKKKLLGVFTVAKVVKADPNQINPSAELLSDGSILWKNHVAVEHDPKAPNAPVTARQMNVWRWFANGKRRKLF